MDNIAILAENYKNLQGALNHIEEVMFEYKVEIIKKKQSNDM